MGYIGPIPAQVPLTSSDIEDGIITADKLATDSVETVKVKDVNITAGKLAATQDLSSKTITLPATVAGLGTGIDAATQLANKVPTANLGTGLASATTYLAGDQSYKALSEFNDDALRNDVATLVLHQATNANAAKYNLVNTNVDQYEDSTGVATFTDCARNVAGEYISSVSSTRNYTTTAGTPASNLTFGSSSWTGGLTNDYSYGGAPLGPGIYPDFLYDLGADWKIRIFNNDSSGNPTNASTYHGSYSMYCAVITTDTSVAAGANPTIFRDQDASIGNTYGNWTPTELRDQWLTDAYGGTLGTDSMTDNYITGSTNQTINMASSSGATVRGYNNTASNRNYGWQVTQDRTANTITIQPSNSADFSTMYTTTNCTFTNVPTTGRFMIYCGYANGAADYVSTTRLTGSGSSNTDFGYFDSESASATGNYISTATTANASVSTMGAVITYKNNAGTNTLNTDIVLEVSANGGTNYTTAVLTAGGTFSTGILQAVANDISVTAGTSIQYRISFANQALASKEARIYGASLMY